MARSIYLTEVDGLTEYVIADSEAHARVEAVAGAPGVSADDVKIHETLPAPSLDGIDGGASRCGTCYRKAEATSENEGYSSCCNDRIEYSGEYNGDVMFLVSVAKGEVRS